MAGLHLCKRWLRPMQLSRPQIEIKTTRSTRKKMTAPLQNLRLAGGGILQQLKIFHWVNQTLFFYKKYMPLAKYIGQKGKFIRFNSNLECNAFKSLWKKKIDPFYQKKKKKSIKHAYCLEEFSCWGFPSTRWWHFSNFEFTHGIFKFSNIMHAKFLVFGFGCKNDYLLIYFYIGNMRSEFFN